MPDRDMRILRGVGSDVLPCRCLVGFYETYDGRSIAILDARDDACPREDHRQGLELSREEIASTRAPAAFDRERR